MEAWSAWIRQLEASGHLKNRGQPLAPTGKVVRGAPAAVTDGPYAEAKDLVLGFIIVEARDMARWGKTEVEAEDPAARFEPILRGEMPVGGVLPEGSLPR